MIVHCIRKHEGLGVDVSQVQPHPIGQYRGEGSTTKQQIDVTKFKPQIKRQLTMPKDSPVLEKVFKMHH